MLPEDLNTPIISTAAGGALGYFLNWIRHSRKDTYDSVAQATRELIDSQNTRISQQNDHIFQLEGRINQLSLQMTDALSESASTKGKLEIALAKLEAANETIRLLETKIAQMKAKEL